VLVIRAADIVS